MAHRSKIFITIVIVFFGLMLSGCSNPATNFSEALKAGDNEKAREILEKNPDLGHMRDEAFRPALIIAAGYGELDLVSQMLDNGTNVNVNYGWHSALHSAVMIRNKEMVILLLAKGADVNMGRERLLKYADDAEIADLLNQRITVVQEIHDATREGDVTKLRDILSEEPILVNSKDSSGKSVLYTAAKNGHKDIIEFIIAKGGKVNQMNDWNTINAETPLFGAAKGGNRDVVELLVENGAEIDRVGPSGYTPLDYAVNYGHIEVVDFLISKGAKVRSNNEREDTLLHIAARSGHKDMAEYLIAKGLKVDAKRYGGGTPLLAAVADEGWASSGLGQRKKEMKEMVEFLIAKGANVNATFDEDCSTALHVAARKGYPEIIDVLVANGANVNAESNNGTTPLHRAAAEGRKEVAGLLIAKGANVNAKGYWRCTPLYQAASSGSAEVVELLLKNGAKVNARNIHDTTPLGIAEYKRRRALSEKKTDSARRYGEVAELLRKHSAVEE